MYILLLSVLSWRMTPLFSDVYPIPDGNETDVYTPFVILAARMSILLLWLTEKIMTSPLPFMSVCEVNPSVVLESSPASDCIPERVRGLAVVGSPPEIFPACLFCPSIHWRAPDDCTFRTAPLRWFHVAIVFGVPGTIPPERDHPEPSGISILVTHVCPRAR